MKKMCKSKNFILFLLVCALFLVYLGIFSYLNLAKYTQHVDSDIAVEAELAREIWVEKDITPDSWLSSTERLVVSTPLVAAPIYGLTGSMTLAMGIACVLSGVALLLTIGFALWKCGFSRLGIASALLALCSLPINGLLNEDQMVPFVTLLWFLFADYYALHCICLFGALTFYIHLVTSQEKYSPLHLAIWGFLFCFCGGLALGGMRCLQVIALPLAVWETILLFCESRRFSQKPSYKGLTGAAFIYSLLSVALLAKLYPTSVDYPMLLQDAPGMVSRLTKEVPAAILECLGIAGNCNLMSLSALMQLGILAVAALTVYGLVYLLRSKDAAHLRQRLLTTGLLASFLLTVLIETVTTASPLPYYFFTVWFVVIAVLGFLVTEFEKKSPAFCRIIVLCVCTFALLNIKYTYADCITTTDNLQEYEEVIAYMESQDIAYGYAEFWDASRICLMTDGEITMGHSYQMEDLGMYWWTTSTKWYVPNLPEDMKTAYVVKQSDKDGFTAQFEDPSIVSLGFENQRFAVYISEKNLVSMN